MSTSPGDCPIPFADIVRAHLWPLGAPTTDTSRCTQCNTTWAEYWQYTTDKEKRS